MEKSASDQRNLSGQLPADLVFADFVLSPSRHRLLRNGQTVPLKPKVYELLCLLLECRERVLSRAEILDRLWPRQDILESSLTQAIYELRKALGDPGWIESVPRHGYRFAGRVQSRSPGADRAPSIAVLPFRLLGLAPDQDWLALALTDHLITALAHQSDSTLAVRSLGAVLPLDQHPGKLTDKALLLGVDTIVEGSVTAAGDRHEVSLRVVRVDDQNILGATTVQVAGKLGSEHLPDLRQRLASWILACVGLAARPAEPRPEPTAAVQALYYRAEACWHRFTFNAWRQAIEYLDRALELEPQHARALALRANSWSAMAALGGVPPREGFARARADAERALALAPDRAWGHESMAAYHLFHDWSPERARYCAERAIAADPQSVHGHHLLALALSAAGQADAALAELDLARQLDPASLLLHNDLGALLHYMGRAEASIPVFDAVLARDPAFAHAHLHKAMALADLGRAEAGIEAATSACRLAGRDPGESGVLARLYRLAGHDADYRQQLGRVKHAVETRQFDPMEMVWATLNAGAPEQTLEWLARAVAWRSRDVLLFHHLPALAALRKHPRAVALLPF